MTRRAARSHPPWWATLAAVLLAAVFAGLGTWQLTRAGEKEEFLIGFDAGLSATPGPAPSGGPPTQASRFRPITATGRYDVAHQFLLDARLRDGRAGYEVLTPLRRAGFAVLVNRGWVPADPDRSRLPDVTVGGEERTVTGLLDRLPRAALAAGPAPEETGGRWPRRLLYPTAAEIAAALGYPVEDYQLLLDHRAADGFARQWRPAVMSAQQHVGYAVQWFALATTVVVIYAVLGFRKTIADHD